MPNDSDPPQIEIKFTDEFKRNLRTLTQKYRHIRSDWQPAIAQWIPYETHKTP
ncbi:MAG: hypothetical protein F6K03_06040 [Kamptonema sp. SIO4C4]|nr:hypothetical protein [Kamptonema sp. SIO4C4]